MTQEILFERVGAWGVITLNRPKALNALTFGMVKAFRSQMKEWESDTGVRAVLVKGAGERAFCAGGDVRWVHETARRALDEAAVFFHEEYRNNAAIFHFPKPYIALIDGIVMGGGVGISIHGDFRIAGDKTLFAMPETGIGLFPDVGGGYFMSRLAGGLGQYFGLTGARARAADCLAAGFATHYCPSDQMDELEAVLLAAELKSDPYKEVDEMLAAAGKDPGRGDLDEIRGKIADLFEHSQSVDDLFSRLNKDESDFAIATLKTLKQMSPLSLKVTFEQMQRGAKLDFDDVMRMEYRLVRRILQGKDFFEGVRAQLIDKDKTPKWDPADLTAVTDEMVAAHFEDLGQDELVLP